MKTNKIIQSGIMIGCLLTSGVFAQDVTKIVVTGTKSARTLKDVSVRTELITDKRIHDKNAQTLYDVLDNEPGIRVEQQCSNCNFSTMRMLGLENYTQILIDGKPVFNGLNAVYGLQQVMASNIDQVEIVKGPGSALYGSDAIAGVINVQLKKPGIKARQTMNASYGDKGEYNFGFSTSQRKGNIAYSVSGQKKYSKAIDENGDNLTDQVEANGTGLSAKVSVFEAIGEGSELYVKGSCDDEFRRGGNFDTWDEPFDPDTEHIKTRRFNGIVGLIKEFNNGGILDMSYSDVENDRYATNGAAWDNYLDVSGNMPATIDPVNDMVKPFITKEKTQLLDLGYGFPFSSDQFVQVGFQAKKVHLDESIDGIASIKKSDEFGVFVQDEIMYGDDIEIVAGVRYDKHKSADSLAGSSYDENSVNPRVAVKYVAGDDLTFRGSIGTSYRVPNNFAEELHLCGAAPKIKKDSSLKSEKALGMTFGMDYQLNDDTQLDINIFRTNIQDKVEIDTDTPPVGYDAQWINAGNAFTQGVEASLTKYMGKDFGIKLDAAFVDAQYDENRYAGENDSKYVPRSPAFTGGTQLMFDNDSGDRAVLEYRYIGEQYIDHTDATPIVEKKDAYSLVNFNYSKTLAVGEDDVVTTYFFNVKNLFNYVQPERDLADAAYIWAPLVGRKVYGGVRFEF